MSAIAFRNVTKTFRMERGNTARTMQDLFVGLLRRKRALPGARSDVFTALRDVNFDIAPGETVGFLGANGAGKSTTLKLISRIIQPTRGSVAVNGRVTALLELGAGFHPDLSGRDNIFLNGTVLGLTRKQINAKLDEIIDFADIGDFIDEPVKDYSSGMQARLGFAVAISLDPQILLIDEALAVGDQAFQQKCNERMLQMRRKGTTMLYVSHSLESVEQLCKRAIWLEHGAVKMDDAARRVAQAYYKASLQQEVDRDRAVSDAPRPGTGEARLTRIELFGADGAAKPAQQIFLTHEPMTIRLHYHAARRIERPAFGIGIFHTGNGAHVAGPNNTLDNFLIPEIFGDGYVDYRIADVPLLPGRYSVTGSIFDWECVRCYDYWSDSVLFDITLGGSNERHGLLSLRGRWSHADA
jgi:lipopolysaccharide transport system ATP-binding protein